MQKENNAINEIENMEIKPKFSVGQDFINNKLLYGVNFNEKSYILTSDREFIKIEEIEEKLGLIPKNNKAELSKIKNETIKKYIYEDNTEVINPVDLFYLIKINIEEYIYLEDERTYTVLALWIMLTYLYTIFSYIPYIHLKGDKGVGKSSLLTLLKNTCFNAVMWSSMTEAVIFRYIDVSNATLLLDEAEDLKNPKNKSLNGILNAGFNKEGMVPRTKMAKNSEKVIQYSTFSMKALAGINDIPNVLKDRCINIQMTKKPKSVKKNKYIDTSKKIQDINDVIIQNLYLFALSACKDIYNIYERFDVNMPECLSSRDTDIYLPLFCIARYIDIQLEHNEIENTLYSYAEDMSISRNQQDIEENISYKLIIDLYEMIIDKKVNAYRECYFLNEDIFGYLQFDNKYYFRSLTSLTNALNTLNIKHTRIEVNGKKGTYYIITKEQLEKLIDSYNISIPKITIKDEF